MESNEEFLDPSQAKEKFQEYLCQIDENEKNKADIGQINTILPGTGKSSLLPSLLISKGLKRAPTYIQNVSIKNVQPDYSRVSTNIYRKSQSKSTDASFILSASDDERSLILNPDNVYRQLWDLLFVTTCLLYTTVRVPYVIAFDVNEFTSTDNVWFISNRIVDAVFLLDIIIVFLTAYKDGRHYVLQHRLIAWNYIKSWFFLDLISSVPLDVIFYLIGGDAQNAEAARGAKLFRIIKIFRTLKILRLFRLKRIFMAMEIALDLNFSMMSILKFVGGIAVSAHMLACGFLFIGHSEDGWLNEPDIGETQSEQYVASLYWTFTTMTTIGYGDIASITSNERIFAICTMILGGVIFTYGITRVIHIVGAMGKSKSYLTDQLESLKEWSNFYDFDDQTMSDIKTYLHYKHTQVYFDEDRILSNLSLPLRKRVLKQVYSKSISEIPLFTIVSSAFLSEIILRLRVEFAQPYQLICKQWEVADTMVIIRKGVVATFKGRKVKDIKSALLVTPGEGIDEIAVLADNVVRLSSAVSLDWCDYSVLAKQDFEELVEQFPTEKRKLKKYALAKIDDYMEEIEAKNLRKRPSPLEFAAAISNSEKIIADESLNIEMATIQDAEDSIKSDETSLKFDRKPSPSHIDENSISLEMRPKTSIGSQDNDSMLEILCQLRNISAQLDALKTQGLTNRQSLKQDKAENNDRFSKVNHYLSDISKGKRASLPAFSPRHQ